MGTLPPFSTALWTLVQGGLVFRDSVPMAFLSVADCPRSSQLASGAMWRRLGGAATKLASFFKCFGHLRIILYSFHCKVRGFVFFCIAGCVPAVGCRLDVEAVTRGHEKIALSVRRKKKGAQAAPQPAACSNASAEAALAASLATMTVLVHAGSRQTACKIRDGLIQFV